MALTTILQTATVPTVGPTGRPKDLLVGPTRLSDREIVDWASLLVDPRKSTSQIIQELLNHCVGDGMSMEDKLTCIRAMNLIKKGVIRDNPAELTRHPLHRGLPVPDGLDGTEQEQE